MSKCGDCKWYIGHQFQGNCHYDAPLKDPKSTTPFQDAVWPALSGDNFCGCFELKDGITMAESEQTEKENG